jgi:hypothetical protein
MAKARVGGMVGFFVEMLAAFGGLFVPVANDLTQPRRHHDLEEWTSSTPRTRQFERTHGRRCASQKSRGNRRKAARAA